MPQQAAGSRIEPPVSEPTAPRTRPAATATPPPLEDPPAAHPGRHGFWASPWCGLSPNGPSASSVMLSLPRPTAPARRSRRTASHSRASTKYSRVLVPHEVGSPGTWQRSFHAIGTPASGPPGRPAPSSRSSAAAVASAPSVSTVMKARRAASWRSIRPRDSRTISTGETRRAARADASAAIVHSPPLRFGLEHGHEPRRLLGEGEIGRGALDPGGGARERRAEHALPVGHRRAGPAPRRASRLLERRELRRPPDLVHDPLDQPAGGLGRLPRGQPLAIGDEGRP